MSNLATAIDCYDAYGLAAWWKQVLAYSAVPGDPNEIGDEECLIADPVTGHRFLFNEVPEEKVIKNRVHFDLVPTDRRRDGEIERVLGLGARLVADRRNAEGTGWTVLADPEGNEFCVLRSPEERAEATSRSE
jgi:Glyoxalase-like domain